MKKLSTHRVIHSPSCQFTLGVVLALTLFSLTVNAQTVVRTGSGGTVSGNDIGEVQIADGAAEGDVIKVSDGATFKTRVTNPVSGFTIESSTGNVVNVPVQVEYNFTQTPTDPVNAAFRNITFTGADSYTSSFWRGELNQNDIIGITIDGKVSFSNFKNSVFDFYQTDTIIRYYPYKFTCTSGSTLTFSGNTTNGEGSAFVRLSELNGNGSFMTFSGNTASIDGGAIDQLNNLTGENNKLTFSNNTANGTGNSDGGGAIYLLNKLSGSGNTLEFSENTAANRGGAISTLYYLSGSGNKLLFSGNTAANRGGAINQFIFLSGSGNTLKFSNNKANGTGDDDGGGAIYILGGFSGSDNTLTFTGNTAKDGGAIYSFNDLEGSGNTLDFSGNTAKDGGAIYQLYKLSGNNNKLTFSNNTANATGDKAGGGAINYFFNLSGSGNTLDFSENTAAKNGGAIDQLSYIGGSGNTLTFTGNTAATRGGAIYNLGYVNIRTGLTGNNNQLTFSNNKANGTGDSDGGGAIYVLNNLSGSGNTLQFSENTAAKSGGAIYQLGVYESDGTASGGLIGNNNQLTFSKNTANGTGDTDGGGAIYKFNLSGSGNTLDFSENTAAISGGAIYQLGVYVSDGTASGGLTGNNNKLTFSNNKANGINPSDITANYGGGAIYELALSGSGNTLEFTGNTAKRSGGAILALTNLSTGSGNTLKFEGNTAEELYGGAVERLYLQGENNIYTFINNTAAHAGGAVERLDIDGNNNKLSFSNNTANGAGTVYDAEGGAGGAIRYLINTGANNTLEFTGNTAIYGGAINIFQGMECENNKLTFSGNTAKTDGGAIGTFSMLGNGNTLEFEGNTAEEGNGGAIGYFGGLFGSNNTLTFTGNTAGNYGGAIYSNFSIEFEGNNTLTFTGNKAGTKGNDIYLGGYDNRPANLTFSGGTYSFDGGIWLAEINNKYGKTTISNGANVTIAGRNDDSVNEYEFRDVALTANLTATVDDIEYLHGNFTAGENGLMTIKKGSDTATIKSSTNYGVMDLLINKAEEVETISISSGRIDIKGCIDASIELQNDATFSPGNSVGHVDIDGDFILNAGTTLLIEMDATGIDTMAATSFDLDNGTISFTLSDEIPGGATYDILTAKNGTAFDEDIITRMLNGQTLPEYYTLALAGPTNNIVRFSIDRNAVPEPSTWALLILGAAGLAYMRKRSRQ